MREYTTPGVYVEEVPARMRCIAGVSTSTTAFVGPTLTASGSADVALSSSLEFERQYGGLDDLTTAGAPVTNYIAHAARAFFDNGGKRLYVVRIEADATAADYAAALDAAYELPDVSVIAAPGYSARSDAIRIQQALIAHVEQAPGRDRYRFAVLDSPPGVTIGDMQAVRAGINSSRVAIYYPWVTTDNEFYQPPSGFVCGIIARVDTERGVWKAPANEAVRGVCALQAQLNDSAQQALTASGVNCLRSFPGRGILLWGARTATADVEWKYISIRRYVLYLEHSISQGLQWVVFEANDVDLWASVRQTVTDFLINDWRSGALLGTKPEEAFFVRCDRATMTQNDIDNGRLVVEIGIAPLRPAEFVVIRIGLWTASHPDP